MNSSVDTNDTRIQSISEKSTGYRQKKIYNTVKRLLDFVLALIFVIILTPLYCIIALLIKLDSSGPVFYRGIRTGRHGKEFKIFKFRSMINDAENLGGGTTALFDKRITKSGAFLRKSKLDEIPQLFNILKGDMSFIGPRPELPRYTSIYQGDEQLILYVRPGITDLSSLEFISLDEIVGSDNADEVYEKYVLKRKNELRIQYVIDQSFGLDFKIFLKTVADVLKKIIKIITNRKTKQYGIYNTTKL